MELSVKCVLHLVKYFYQMEFEMVFETFEILVNE